MKDTFDLTIYLQISEREEVKRTMSSKENMQLILQAVSEEALKRVKKEKATRLKRKTLKLIALSKELTQALNGM